MEKTHQIYAEIFLRYPGCLTLEYVNYNFSHYLDFASLLIVQLLGIMRYYFYLSAVEIFTALLNNIYITRKNTCLWLPISVTMAPIMK